MNREHVERIAKIVDQYSNEDGSPIDGAVRDILIELHHFCVVNQINFYSRIDMAEEVFQQELDDVVLDMKEEV